MKDKDHNLIWESYAKRKLNERITIDPETGEMSGTPEQITGDIERAKILAAADAMGLQLSDDGTKWVPKKNPESELPPVPSHKPVYGPGADGTMQMLKPRGQTNEAYPPDRYGNTGDGRAAERPAIPGYENHEGYRHDDLYVGGNYTVQIDHSEVANPEDGIVKYRIILVDGRSPGTSQDEVRQLPTDQFRSKYYKRAA